MIEEPIALFGPAEQRKKEQELIPLFGSSAPDPIARLLPVAPQAAEGYGCRAVRLIFDNVMGDVFADSLGPDHLWWENLTALACRLAGRIVLESAGETRSKAKLESGGLLYLDLSAYTLLLDQLERESHCVVFSAREVLGPRVIQHREEVRTFSLFTQPDSEDIREVGPPAVRGDERKDVGAVPTELRPIRFQTILCDRRGSPFSNLPYEVVLDGNREAGTTGQSGELTIVFEGPFDEGTLTLFLSEQKGHSLVWPLFYRDLGSLENIEGVRDRLHFLDFATGGCGNRLDLGMVKALAEFQNWSGCPHRDGALDHATREALQKCFLKKSPTGVQVE